MTGAMLGIGTKRKAWRPITAVIVLYAFVLQSFLGGLLPIRMLDQAGMLCAEMNDTARNGGDGPVKSPPLHHAACCIAACAVADAGLAPAAAGAVPAWPLREAAAPSRRPEIRVAARAPPGSIPSPRGPPAA